MKERNTVATGFVLTDEGDVLSGKPLTWTVTIPALSTYYIKMLNASLPHYLKIRYTVYAA